MRPHLTNSAFRSAQALLETGAFKVDRKRAFIYVSRRIGPVYIDVRLLSRSAEAWLTVIEGLMDLVHSEVGTGSFDLISGGELGDLLFSIPVALRLQKPHIIIRRTEKGYGVGGRFVGSLEKGQRAMHVSDLIMMGTSALSWVEAIRSAGGMVNDYVVVFDRMQGGKEKLALRGVKLHSLLQMDKQLFEFATQQGVITEEDYQELRAYLSDADLWARSVLRSNPEFFRQHIEVVEGRLTRKEGIEVLTIGYPDLIPEFRTYVVDMLREMRVKESLPELEYYPSF